MKILYICNLNPFENRSGGHQRGNHILQALMAFADVDILYIHGSLEKSIDAANVTNCVISRFNGGKFKKRIKQFFYLFNISPNMITPSNHKCIKAFNKILKEKDYDIVFFRYLKPYLECGMPQLYNMVVDVDDLPWQESLCLSQNSQYSCIKRLYHRYRTNMIEHYANIMFHRFRLAFFSNKFDIKCANGVYLQNIPYVDDTNSICDMPEQQPRYILFVGTLSHVPNIEGLDHFITKIWPHILKQHPDIRLKIVGRGLPPTIKRKWHSVQNLDLMGYVESLPLLYRQCTAVISPIYSGAGTNIKVLEALLYEKVCIISDFSHRGFEEHLKDGNDLYICYSDKEYVEKLSYALEHSDKLKEMAKHGSMQVHKYFSIEKFKETIKSSLEKEFTEK